MKPYIAGICKSIDLHRMTILDILAISGNRQQNPYFHPVHPVHPGHPDSDNNLPQSV